MMAKMANVALVALTLAAGGLAEESRSLASGVWGAWKSERVKSKYFSELMADGDTVELLTHGPFTISAACGTLGGEAEVRLLLTVTADSDADEWVYGYPDFLPQDYYNSCVGTTAAGTVSDTCIVWGTVSGSGFPDDAGAYTSLSGYYVSFGGPGTIGFNKEALSNEEYLTYANGFTAEEVAAFPNDCAISGELTYNRASGDDP
ncbi:unnamed protein product [Ectocarpus fasciculatus]